MLMIPSSTAKAVLPRITCPRWIAMRGPGGQPPGALRGDPFLEGYVGGADLHAQRGLVRAALGVAVGERSACAGRRRLLRGRLLLVAGDATKRRAEPAFLFRLFRLLVIFLLAVVLLLVSAGETGRPRDVCRDFCDRLRIEGDGRGVARFRGRARGELFRLDLLLVVLDAVRGIGVRREPSAVAPLARAVARIDLLQYVSEAGRQIPNLVGELRSGLVGIVFVAAAPLTFEDFFEGHARDARDELRAHRCPAPAQIASDVDALTRLNGMNGVLGGDMRDLMA